MLLFIGISSFLNLNNCSNSILTNISCESNFEIIKEIDMEKTWDLQYLKQEIKEYHYKIYVPLQ